MKNWSEFVEEQLPGNVQTKILANAELELNRFKSLKQTEKRRHWILAFSSVGAFAIGVSLILKNRNSTPPTVMAEDLDLFVDLDLLEDFELVSELEDLQEWKDNNDDKEDV